MTDTTPPPCKRRGSHAHTLAYDNPSRPNYRRSVMGDRCNSLLLWSTAAWASLAELNPTIDGHPLAWKEARAYLNAHAARSNGGLARRALKMLDRTAAEPVARRTTT